MRIQVTENPYSCIFYAVNFLPIFFGYSFGIQEQGTECGECEERGECSLSFRGISRRVPGNALILGFRRMLEKILGNVQEDEKKRNC